MCSMYISTLSACISTHQKTVSDSCELPWGCWELNSGPSRRTVTVLNHWAIFLMWTNFEDYKDLWSSGETRPWAEAHSCRTLQYDEGHRYEVIRNSRKLETTIVVQCPPHHKARLLGVAEHGVWLCLSYTGPLPDGFWAVGTYWWDTAAGWRVG